MSDPVYTPPAVGDRFVWEIPQVNFGPIFIEVARVIRGGQCPRAYLHCTGPDGRPFRRARRQPLPLPASMRREDWTENDVQTVITATGVSS